MSDRPGCVHLLRHGPVAGAPALYGRTDVALAPEAQTLLAPLFAQASPYDQIISSPRTRCLQSAQALAGHWQVPLTVRPEWAELDFGDLDGRPFSELTEQWPLLEAFWQAPARHTLPGAEPLVHFHARVLATWQSLLAELGEQRVLVVTHGGVIRQLVGQLLAADWRSGALQQGLHLPYASLTRIWCWAGEPPVCQIRQLAASPAQLLWQEEAAWRLM
ncbi:histidine phosphatase family protein [Pseudaeromonas paramecii]|uniref:Histidine phosphatase family protein n=1 Tax=Pseudaeromonas paramecii TaxID=2138166 RepID=A0ABP8PWE2_9GAMM